MGPALLVLFQTQINLLTDVGLWSCGRRTASSKRSGKSTGLLAPYAVGGQSAFSDQDYRSTMTVSFRALRSVARAHLYRLRLLCPQNLTSGRRSPNGWHHNP